jgi:hypothetical protein
MDIEIFYLRGNQQGPINHPFHLEFLQQINLQPKIILEP